MFKRILTSIAALAFAAVAQAAAGDYVDRSGTITAGGTSQQLVAADDNRGNITIYNLGTESEVLCVNVTSAASCTAAGSWQISPGGSLTLTTKEAINVVAATTGHKFTSKEKITAGFALVNPGSSSGSGGGLTDTQLRASAVPVSAAQSGTWTVQPGNTANTTAWKVDGSAVTQPVSLASVPSHAVTNAGTFAVQETHFSTTATSDTTRAPVSPPDGAQVSGSISAAIPTATVTISTASPGVITWTSHGRVANEPIVLTTGGTMAAPFVAGNTYYVKTVIDANSFTLSATPGGTAINTSSSGTGTQTATASVIFWTDTSGYGGLSFAFGPNGTGVNVIFEQSEDASYWFSTLVVDRSSISSTLNLITTVSGSSSTSKYWPKVAKYFRVRATAYSSGTTTLTGSLLHGSPTAFSAMFVGGNSGNINIVGPTGDSGTATFNPVQVAVQTKTANRAALATDKVVSIPATVIGAPIVRPWSIPEAETPYAAGSGGVSNSTADQTLASAAAAGIRNYLTGIDLMCEALGTASEITIRDGSGGTVLWRTKVGTGGQPLVGITFQNPKKTTAATALIWKMETASGTGACYLNGNTFQAP